MRSRMLVATALLAPLALAAQPAARRASRAFTPPPVMKVDPARVADALARADVAWQEGRGKDARRIYQDLIAQQRAAGEFAATAMWRLALNYLYADETMRAAVQLDELADAAATYGDPSMQLRATFEAATLWQQLKRGDLVMPRVERARALLQSPAIPDAEKELVKRRMQ